MNKTFVMRPHRWLPLVALAFLGYAPAWAQSYETHSFTNLNRAIPDGNWAGLSDVQQVTSSVSQLTGLRVNLRVDGEYNGDLYCYVRHVTPTATNFCVLLNRPGRSAALPHGYSDSGLDVQFDDAAANGNIHIYQGVTNPPAGTPLRGAWAADGRRVSPDAVLDATPVSTSLSSFAGVTGSGEWTLFVADVDTGATNMLVGWEIQLTGVLTPVITWSNPADITYGTPLSGTQLNASSGSVPGTFTYNPTNNTILNAGTQTLTAIFTPNDLTTYLATTTSVSINVLKKALTIAAQNASKVYGQPDPALTATYSGFVNGESASVLGGILVVTRAAGEMVQGGPYAITPSGRTSSNYNISYVTGAFSITPASLAVIGDPKTKTYGAADPALTYAVTGLKFTDTASSVLTGSLTRVAGETVAGSPYAIARGTLTANANYTLTFTGNSLGITPAALSVVADAKTKTYGAADPALTYVVTGLQFTDTAASVLTGSLVRGPGETVAGSPYAITRGTLVANPNYTLTFTGNSLSITPAALSVVADAKTKAYGAADPTLTYVATGLQLTDTAASVLSGSLTRATGETVAGSPYAIARGTLAANANYTLAFTGNSLSITPAALSVVADAKTKSYGVADPALSYTVTGLQFTDTAASVLTGSLTRATGETVAGSPYAIARGTLAANANYTLTFTGNSLSITPAALSVAADAKTKTYGAADPALTYVVSGLKFTDTPASVLTGSLTRASGETVAGSPYTIARGSLAANANYTLNFTGNSLSITAAALAVIADAKTKTYGAADPVLTYAVTGLQFTDTAASVLTGSLTRAVGESVLGSPYSITRGTLAANANYTLTFTGNGLSITAAALAVVADAKTKSYGAADPALTYVATGLKFTDTAASVLTGSLTRAAGETVAGSPYAITRGTLAANANYTLNFTGNSLSIAPALLAVSADPKSKTYGAPDPALTYAVSGLQFADTAGSVLTGNLTRAAGETVAGSPYAITRGTVAANANYSLIFSGNSLVIGKASTAGIVGVSPNPAKPGQPVTFTFSLSAVAPGAGIPTGSVQFRVDGATAGAPATVTSGVASYADSTLLVGTHAVAAEYAGDSNFVGVTNSLPVSLLINTPPVAGLDTITRSGTNDVKVEIAVLLSNDTDADGDAITFTTFSASSTGGGTITRLGDWITYTPSPGSTNSDSFTYSINDGRGVDVSGTVNVNVAPDTGTAPNLIVTDQGNGWYLLTFNGVPGLTYRIEYCIDLQAPNWQPLGAATANTFGEFEYLDRPPAGAPARYYRSAYP